MTSNPQFCFKGLSSSNKFCITFSILFARVSTSLKIGYASGAFFILTKPSGSFNFFFTFCAMESCVIYFSPAFALSISFLKTLLISALRLLSVGTSPGLTGDLISNLFLTA